jgi:hypothetical protein
LLIQSIAAGIDRLDAGDPAISSGTTMNAVDRSTPLIAKSMEHLV